MNKEIADKWVAALKSGKYSQGTEYLHHMDYDGTETFCAVGVLCDVIDPTGWKKNAIDEDESEFIFAHHGYQHGIDDEIFEECGFRGNPKEPECPIHEIYKMNDDERVSFTEIAEYIEQNWEKL